MQQEMWDYGNGGDIVGNKRVGIRRTVTGSDGEVRTFTESEDIYNELIEQLLATAPYNGILVNKFELLDNAYRASGGFENGDYLIPHPREKQQKYVRRKNMAYFINYVKPIVDALVNPIFKTDPVRDGMSTIYESFVEDVDGNNTSLTRFMKKAAIRAKLHGVEFIVVDMERISSDSIITKRTIIDNRIYPYLYLVSPSQVTGWATNKFGKLVSITYTVTNVTIDSDGNSVYKPEVWTWTESRCKKTVDGTEVVFDNPIGVIPIIPLYGAINDSDDLIPQSDVYAIAKTNFALYNACSELRERNRAQAFSLLTYPIADDDDYDTVDQPLKVGVNDLLMYRASTGNRPEFITPPPDSSEILLNEINFMVKEIYRMASLRMNTDVNTYNVSAVARKIENQQYYQSIAELAQGLQETEKMINKVFNIYMGDNGTRDFNISYNKEYAILDTTEVLNNATSSLALEMTNEYNKEMRKQVARATLADIDTNTLNEIIKSIDNSKESENPLDSEATVVQPTRS